MEIIENSLSVPERPPGRVQRLSASLAGNDAEAVVLDLVQPLAAGRQLIGLRRKARCDEASREGAQHLG